MAKHHNLTLFKGERVTISVTMDPVVDITGWTIVFNWAKSINNATKLIDDRAMTVDNGPLGTFHVTLSAADTDRPIGSSYYFDIWRADSGNEKPLAYGTLVLLGSAKKPE